MFFMPLAWKKFFLQHAENCVHTSVFARHEPKNTVITVIFATRGKKRRKYRGIGTEAQKKTSVCTVLFAPRVLKKCENTTYVTIFGGPQKCKNTMCCKNNKNKNNDNNNKKKFRRSTNMRQKDVLQAAVWKEHRTVLCTCAHAPSTWTTPTFSLLYITLMASPVCEALQYLTIWDLILSISA